MVSIRILMPRRLCGIEIAEFKEKSSSGFDDFLRGRIGWLIHAAFIARKAEDARNPREAGGDFAPRGFIRVLLLEEVHTSEISRGDRILPARTSSPKEPIQQSHEWEDIAARGSDSRAPEGPFDFVPDSRVM